VHLRLHLGLGSGGFSRFGPLFALFGGGGAVVRRETNRGVDLELDRREDLLHLARDVRVLEKIADLVGDDAEEAVLGLVDLLQDIARDLLRELELADEVLQRLGGVLRPVDADLDRPLQELGDDPLETLPPGRAPGTAGATARAALRGVLIAHRTLVT
jgi:hypothetical protein